MIWIHGLVNDLVILSYLHHIILKNLPVSTGCMWRHMSWVCRPDSSGLKLQRVTSPCHHVWYVLIEFTVTAREVRLTGLLRRCSFSWNVLLLHWTLDQGWGKRSGAEVCCELQEGGQRTSVQVPKGQLTKPPSSSLFGCRNMRIKTLSLVNVLPFTDRTTATLD